MDFAPPPGLRNPHVQSVLASAGPRRLLAGGRFAPLLAASRRVVLQTPGGPRLLAFCSPRMDAPALVTLVHGWEGSSDSTYILSLGSTLFAAGLSVLRLNLRDHGDSHGLNRELFHSARTEEVVEAVAQGQRLFPHRQNHLVGFSLGGNFALRVALAAGGDGPALDSTVAVCPVLDPAKAIARMGLHHPFYSRYFLRKWKRSLRIKQALDPSLGLQGVLNLPDLDAMTDHLVTHHTPFADSRDYYSRYDLTDGRLSGLRTPTRIIQAEDDPIIPFQDLSSLPPIAALERTITPRGGHCGFIDSLAGPSRIDRLLAEIFA